MDSFVTDTQALVKFMMGKKVINDRSHQAFQSADRGESAIIIPAIVLQVDLTETDIRKLIDEQLRAAGWEADTAEIRYSKGVRPEKGENKAIADWPTQRGPADYVLFNLIV